MARNKDFEYIFRWTTISEKGKPVRTAIALTKHEPGDYGNVLAEYIVSGDIEQERDGACMCDCPASFHTKFDPHGHKHILWARRWAAIMAADPRQQPGSIVYYCTRRDKFFKLNTLA